MLLMSRLGIGFLLVMAVAAGYYLGMRQAVHFDTGRADVSADGDGSIIVTDWTYGFGDGVQWTDAKNTWHESGAPDCLPPLTSVNDLHFAWIDASVEDFGWRQVIWIDCRSGTTAARAP
jgi:hypothetical protein